MTTRERKTRGLKVAYKALTQSYQFEDGKLIIVKDQDNKGRIHGIKVYEQNTCESLNFLQLYTSIEAAIQGVNLYGSIDSEGKINVRFF